MKLIEPTMEYEKDIWQFRQEFISSNDEDKFGIRWGIMTEQTER